MSVDGESLAGTQLEFAFTQCNHNLSEFFVKSSAGINCDGMPCHHSQVMLRPASEGTGVIAGGAVRVVLELAGVKNGFGKQLGSNSPLNNARATLVGIASMKTFKMVSKDRGISVAELMGLDQKKKKGAPGPTLPSRSHAVPIATDLLT